MSMRINTLSGKKTVTLENGSRMMLDYYLVQEPSSENPDMTAYGIGVVRQTEGIEEEREWIPGISYSREKTEALLGRMMGGSVTPVTAVNIIDDWM